MRLLLLLFSLPLFAHTPEEVLSFWLGDHPNEAPLEKAYIWFQGGEEVDRKIEVQFGSLYKEARFGRLDHWKESAQGRLALLILLDQFPRNLFRGAGEAFLTDALALHIALEGIEQGVDRTLSPIGRLFFYLPLEHAEDLQIQRQCVKLFTRLAADVEGEAKGLIERALEYAHLHCEVIERFGRFPSRNNALNRPSTEGELAYLERSPPF